MDLHDSILMNARYKKESRYNQVDSHMINDTLRKEERIAIDKLESLFENRFARNTIRLTLTDIETDFTFFTNQQLKTSLLPKGRGWIWNQSRSRKTVQLRGYEICFYKVNARIIKYSPYTAPSYKVWIYHIKHGIEQFSFFWCEKGNDEASAVIQNDPFQLLSIPSSKPQFRASSSPEKFEPDYNRVVPVTLEELSFLKPYVSSNTASVFGW